MLLQIKFVQDRDGGIYECQVSTSTGTISRRVELSVVFPEAYIKGGEEYHVDEGSPISLTCVLTRPPARPSTFSGITTTGWSTTTWRGASR